jgi:protein disulfide-isomerase A6|eukprot:gene5929-11863_t
MKQAWEDLGTAFESSSSVVVGDVDCTIETDIASEYGVSGYPTIKYFTAETDPKGDSYSGGRDFDSLKTFVEEKLERKCDVADPTTCSEKEQKFITKMADKDEAAIAKEIGRLEGMKGKSMKAEQKAFLFQRLYILGQLSPAGKEEL